ncbi:hypothetical protein D9758_009761 [Tetrapyrgos nigripes]|uniref:ABC transporter domain-containing protein n=1 Tax=Tetrapyrgos nigripes TaxID=182062 RepID=A0A8H5GKK5_9AGAR|nr:hypothetical protein D9758_009761 [Tetrapyrgos nigripes]
MIGGLRWVTHLNPSRWGSEIYILSGTCSNFVPSGPGYSDTNSNISLANQASPVYTEPWYHLRLRSRLPTLPTLPTPFTEVNDEEAGANRRLLDDVSVYVAPGKFTALMDGSEAGKTTLLNALAQRVSGGVVSGDGFVDSEALSVDFQAQTGYYQQLDVHNLHTYCP